MVIYNNNYVHFDIKPENILILHNLILKISDFSTLKKIDMNVSDLKIPGGTPGYLSPEYYLQDRISREDAQKQDFFALGASLFTLKFGFSFMKVRRHKEEQKKIIADSIIDQIMRNMNYINSSKTADEEFIDLLLKLIQYKAEDRYNLENIYRNKWLNKDLKYIYNCADNFDIDEEKFLMELQKLDFLIEKEKIFKTYKKLMNQVNQVNDNSKEKNSKKINNEHKFRFKKKKI